MSHVRLMILFLIVIFILGFVSGAALSPFLLSKTARDTCFKSSFEERLFGLKYLESMNGISDEQQATIRAVADSYNYEVESTREDFRIVSLKLRGSFVSDIAPILTAEQLEKYKKYLDEKDEQRLKKSKRVR